MSTITPHVKIINAYLEAKGSEFRIYRHSCGTLNRRCVKPGYRANCIMPIFSEFPSEINEILEANWRKHDDQLGAVKAAARWVLTRELPEAAQ